MSEKMKKISLVDFQQPEFAQQILKEFRKLGAATAMPDDLEAGQQHVPLGSFATDLASALVQELYGMLRGARSFVQGCLHASYIIGRCGIREESTKLMDRFWYYGQIIVEFVTQLMNESIEEKFQAYLGAMYEEHAVAMAKGTEPSERN